jgi:hypothetical protein
MHREEKGEEQGWDADNQRLSIKEQQTDLYRGPVADVLEEILIN